LTSAAPPRRATLVHDWLTGMRGGENVLEALLPLLPGAPIHTLFHFPGTVSPAIEARPIHTSLLQGLPGTRRHYRKLLPLFPAAIEDFDLGAFDLVVSSSHCVAKGCIPHPGAVHVCYCHTPMRYAWDQQHAYFPKRSGPLARMRSMVLAGLRVWDVASAARVDRFLANSRFVADRIRRYYGRDAEVVHPPVDVDFFTPPDDAPARRREEGYLLAVSALAPYKRLEVAIAGCERAGLELRIVGDGPERARLERLAGIRTRFLGRVDRDELRELYRGALAFVQPGIEDFGIAPVEALACGTPVVAHGRGGVLDIVEDGVHGVLYRDDDGPEALSATLEARLDTIRKIGFNGLNLRHRAEAFAARQFTERMRAILTPYLETTA